MKNQMSAWHATLHSLSSNADIIVATAERYRRHKHTAGSRLRVNLHKFARSSLVSSQLHGVLVWPLTRICVVVAVELTIIRWRHILCKMEFKLVWISVSKFFAFKMGVDRNNLWLPLSPHTHHPISYYHSVHRLHLQCYSSTSKSGWFELPVWGSCHVENDATRPSPQWYHVKRLNASEDAGDGLVTLFASQVTVLHDLNADSVR